MADEPTPEEIARVDAWRERQRAEQKARERREAEERKRAEEERKEKTRVELEAKLKGRTIARVDGRLDWSYEWEDLRLTFEDGGSLKIEMYGAGEDSELELTFNDPPEDGQ